MLVVEAWPTLKKFMLVLAFALMLAFVPNVARSYDWSKTPINSGYAVTTDWHGIEVPPGVPVTARAGTTDLSVETVWFRWLRPDGAEAWTIEVEWDGTLDTWEGQSVRVFFNSQTPIEAGDWGVQAIFYGEDGHGRGPLELPTEKVAIRARSFFAIPETPWGPLAVMLAMFGALGLFMMKKRRPIPLNVSNA